MEDENGRIAEKVQALSDIELAVLICLVADQHCIIETETTVLNGVEKELRIVASDVFGLSSTVLDCTANTTVDDFGSGILVKDEGDGYFNSRNGKVRSDFPPHSESSRFLEKRTSNSSKPLTPMDSRRIANIVIAKNLNKASAQVQVQALELMRGKRNFTRTAVHAAPRPFLFVALNVGGTARLSTHLADQFFISHKHQDVHGLPNLEELESKDLVSEDDASTSSVVRSPPAQAEKRGNSSLTFSEEDLKTLTSLTAQVMVNSEVRAYLHNIVVFMRLHRAVAGGISAMGTRHFNTLVHVLAPLHGLSYVTPSLVALAARKTYPHRITITTPENERSMQWGSSLDAVKAVLRGVTVEDVIEEVLESVEAPL
ncbi:hypothetical protein BDV95DRAFT_517307 [Massariosphaeria phaeospora]|uniref:magnesium chelatase n=1 Tax=Massariosphaeria phaeospora TaxID=100035 RepID=A0A7C8MB95_9PLEO|nr:hypothetical protein BDV95DRAFT_517307 [Massariosphaeria phaeospora]